MAQPKTLFQKACAFHNMTTEMALAIPDHERRSERAMDVLDAFSTASDLKESVIAHGDVMATIRATKPFYEGNTDNQLVKERVELLWQQYRKTLDALHASMEKADAWLKGQGFGEPFKQYLDSNDTIDRQCALTQAELNSRTFLETHRGYLDMRF